MDAPEEQFDLQAEFNARMDKMDVYIVLLAFGIHLHGKTYRQQNRLYNSHVWKKVHIDRQYRIPAGLCSLS